MRPATQHCSTLEASIDALIARVGRRIAVAIPLGIGKPNPWINALYRRAKADPGLELKIVTALSLNRPRGHSSLEKRLLEPLLQRVFGNYPDLDYAQDVKQGALPPNVEVFEFFLKSGEALHNPSAQQHYLYSNYTHAVRDALALGVNVFAQALAYEDGPEGRQYSLSSNPDLCLDALAQARALGPQVLTMVGVLNASMPFLPNDAVIAEQEIDILCSDPAATHDLFAPPNPRVDTQDHAIALWASTLVKDGGTLQIGIGSLGDGIAHALILRNRDNPAYRALLNALGAADQLPPAQLEAFAQGLYGCSEMFVNGLLELIEAGIVCREVFADAGIQALLNAGSIGVVPDARSLAALWQAGLIASPLTAADCALLQQYGILAADVVLRDGCLWRGLDAIPATPADPEALARINANLLGARMRGGICMHGGFFIGPRRFYQRLRTLPPALRNKLGMTRVSFINQLYGQEDLARQQRRDAAFINSTMMATLLGAAVSDGFESGAMVSGVGGQYNFVAQAHSLPGACSALMLRAWRYNSRGKAVSNIVWNYGHTTIPRHLRDRFITEYGIADVRGQPDAEVIKRMLAIADSRFQGELLARAKAAGKIAADYEIPQRYRANLPQRLGERLAPFCTAALLPDYPFGSDLDAVEQRAAAALMQLKLYQHAPFKLLLTAWRGMRRQAPRDVLLRLDLLPPRGLADRLLSYLVAGSL